MSLLLPRLESSLDLVDRVYRTLVDAITDGSLAPGARITQEEIATQLAVSRQPVLQALRLLKNEGLLLDAPGRGLLVAPLDPEWMMHAYQVRGALDSLAARMAAQRRAHIDPRVIENGRKAARGRNVRAMIDADIAFHRAIYEASGNPLIEPNARLHWTHLRRIMGAVLQQSRQREAVWDEHEAIAAAIEAGDPARAARLIEQHTRSAGENLARQLQAVLETQGVHA